MIGYLAWYEGMDLDAAYEMVRDLRACDPYIDAIRTVHAGGRFTSPGIRDADARADR